MATSAEPVQLDRLTLLKTGGEAKPAIVGKFTSLNAAESMKVAEDLRKVKADSSKEAIKSVLAVKEGETHFNVRKGKDAIDRFGAGRVAPPPLTIDEIANKSRAKELFTNYSKLAAFLELKTMSSAQQTAYLAEAEVQAALGVGAPMTFNTLKTQALDFVIKEPSFIAMFPEVNNQSPALSAAEKRSFIESTLMPAEDGRFASRVGTRLQEVYKKVVDFTPTSTEEQKSNFIRQQTEANGTRDQRINSMKTMLDAQGIINPVTGVAYTIAELNGFVGAAGTPEVTADAVAESILNQPLATFVDLKKLVIELPKQQADLVTKFKAAVPPAPDPVADPVGFGAWLLAHPGVDVTTYNTGVAELARLNGAFPPGHADLTAFNARILPLYRNPAFSTLSSEAKASDLKSAELTAKIAALATMTVDEKKSHDKRMLEEDDAIALLTGIMGESIGDVLEERYDLMEERQERFMEQNAKKAEQAVAKLVLELKKKMNENWIGHDASHKKVVHKEQIKKDVTHLAFTYDKDMALKQMIARDLFAAGGGPLTTANFDTLNVVDGTNGATPPVQLLNETQMAQVNKIFESTGTMYRDKLFADMFAARGGLDRSINFGIGEWVPDWAKLGFKREEWRYMMQQYEPEITKALASNREAAAAMKSLEAQGVKMDISLKWLWYVIAVVLGIGTGGIGTAVAGGGAALGGLGVEAGAIAGGLVAGGGAKAVDSGVGSFQNVNGTS